MPVHLTAEQLARRLRCSQKTVYRWAERDDFPPVLKDYDIFTSRTQLKFDLERVQDWLIEKGMWDHDAQMPDIHVGRYRGPTDLGL